MITYPYRKSRRPNGSYVGMPVIPIECYSHKFNIFIIVEFLVDSGADVSMISKDSAEMLGLDVDWNDEKPLDGVGGTVQSCPAKIRAKLIAKHAQKSLNIPVRVIPSSSGVSSMPNILGRSPFFEWFDILFRESEQKLILRPTDKLH